MRCVVVTGLGVVSPGGFGANTACARLLAARSGRAIRVVSLSAKVADIVADHSQWQLSMNT
jgi:hypothetical protein